MAQAFEADPDVEVVVGMGARDPSVPLERTDFVRVADHSYSTVHRIVLATGVDTIVHTGVMVDSTLGSNRLHDVNVIGTLNLLAAAGAVGSTVKALVVKSSGLFYGATSRDPYAFTETMTREAPAHTPLERSLLEAEALVRDFAQDNPAVIVSVLRFANVLGADLSTPLSRNLSRPMCPSLFGYDPLLQFVEQGDVVRALIHAVRSAEPGTFNVGAPGRLPLSEVAAICGTRLVPLPPWQTGLFSVPFTRLGAFDLPPELIPLLRYGRGMDTDTVPRDRVRLPLLERGGDPRLRPGHSPPQGGRASRRELSVPRGPGAFPAPGQLGRQPGRRAVPNFLGFSPPRIPRAYVSPDSVSHAATSGPRRNCHSSAVMA